MDGGAEALDHETSLMMARRVRAQYRRCWRNAARAVRHLGEGACYVEGWVVVHRADPLVIEHGWCEVDERIIDPTYTPYVSTLEPPLAYHPGMRFDMLAAESAAHERTLPIAKVRRTLEYETAFDAAWLDASRRVAREPCAPTRVVNCRREASDVFIGRPSKWSGPYHFGRDGSRADVLAKYHQWLIRQPLLLREVFRLRGLALGCDCAPEPCHGDVLAELADAGTEHARDGSGDLPE